MNIHITIEKVIWFLLTLVAVGIINSILGFGLIMRFFSSIGLYALSYLIFKDKVFNK